MPTTPDIWTVLWPVIIGGVLALLPSVVAQVISHILGERTSAKALRRQRFEALSNSLWDYEHWIEVERNHQVFKGPAPEGHSPLSRVMTIAAMDFPELLPLLDQLELEGINMSKWSAAAGLKRLKGEMDDLNEGFDATYRAFRQKIVESEVALRAVARTLEK